MFLDSLAKAAFNTKGVNLGITTPFFAYFSRFELPMLPMCKIMVILSNTYALSKIFLPEYVILQIAIPSALALLPLATNLPDDYVLTQAVCNRLTSIAFLVSKCSSVVMGSLALYSCGGIVVGVLAAVTFTVLHLPALSTHIEKYVHNWAYGLPADT